MNIRNRHQFAGVHRTRLNHRTRRIHRIRQIHKTKRQCLRTRQLPEDNASLRWIRLRRAPPPDCIHIVSEGENLFRIAILYSMTVREISSFNNLLRDDQLSVGQELSNSLRALRVAGGSQGVVAVPRLKG